VQHTIRTMPNADKDDREPLRVLQVGPADAELVLVLVPGRGEAAGGFRLVAQDLVERVPGLQVWAVDRREQAFADQRDDPAEATLHYLSRAYRRPDPQTAARVADWGLDVQLRDIRAVVLAARDGDRRRVVLGGHSLGGTAVLTYAAWDFDGSPGYRDLAGMAVIDGGVRDALSGAGIEFSLDAAGARDWLARIERGEIFDNATSLYNNFGDEPEAAALWYQLAAQWALADPHGRSVLADQLPEQWRPGRPVTNAGLLGWLVDEHAALPGYSVRSGHLDESGDWVQDGITPLSRVATCFAGTDVAAWEWFSPNRLALDYFGAAAFADDEVARSLGLRLEHVADIDVPLYVFQSALTGGTVGKAAEQLAADTRIPSVEVHGDDAMTHLDILFAAAEHNTFTGTVAQFLANLR
jgi:hypothetical protein